MKGVMKIIDYFQDYKCPTCQTRRPIGGFTTWLRIKPESAQQLYKVSGATAKFRKTVIEAILAKWPQTNPNTDAGLAFPLNATRKSKLTGQKTVIKKICVGLFFGLSEKCKNKDVDNMTKAILDSLKGKSGLFNDDSEIVHLEVFKRVLVPSKSVADNYCVGIRIMMYQEHDDAKIDFSWDNSVPVL